MMDVDSLAVEVVQQGKAVHQVVVVLPNILQVETDTYIKLVGCCPVLEPDNP